MASIIGTIQSAGGAIGNYAKLMTKYCHMCVETRWSWYGYVQLSQNVKNELQFWLKHIHDLNGQNFKVNVSCDIEFFSDASDYGFGGFISYGMNQNSSGCWTDSESEKSSTWRESQAVNKLLLRFACALEGHTVRWNVDNKNVVSILTGGSMKPDRQMIAVQIHETLFKYSIILFPEWIPREMNVQADILSRPSYRDSDDWQISQIMFNVLNSRWGQCTVDRFATDSNNKCTRFNSKVWMFGTEAVNSMTVSWSSEFNWVVPPPNYILPVIHKIYDEKANGILIVPVWTSAPYWPVLFDKKFAKCVKDTFKFQKEKHVVPGLGKNGIFANKLVSFQMMACLVKF